MGRLRNFIAALGSGYVLLAAITAANLFTFPFALHILGSEQVGVITGVLQTVAFLQLLEFGMGPSVARLLVEYQRIGHEGAYASFFKGAVLVGLVQAFIIGVSGLFLARPVMHLLDIPLEYFPSFHRLLTISLAANAVTCACIPLQQLLYAHHRTDLLNYNAIAGTIGSGATLVLFLWHGFGFEAYAISSWTHVVINQTGTIYHVCRLKLLPTLRAGGVAEAPFRRTLGFASNVWLVMLGAQIITYAPIVLISRIFGPTSLATWRAGTQLLGLALQMVGRLPQAAEPAFWQMWSSGETDRFRARLLQLTRITSAVAIVIGGGLIAVNATFVQLWTSSAIIWDSRYDLGCAVWLLFTALSVTWNMIPGITTRLGNMRWFYLGEGILALTPLFLPALLPSLGTVPWVLAGCILAGRLSYGAHRLVVDIALTKERFRREVGRILFLAIAVFGFGYAVQLATAGVGGVPQFLIAACLYGVSGSIVLWKFALVPALERDQLANSA